MASDRWHDGSAYDAFIGRWSRRVAERFLPWLDVPRGAAWVDVGCGTGVLTRAILDLEDPESVIGIDPSTAFLATARTSVRDPRVAFVPGSADALPEGPATAGVVVAGLVLNFIADLPAALAEMRRVARDEALVAGYVWDYAGEMQALRRFWDAAVMLDPGASKLDEGARFPICQPDALEAAFRKAGFEEVATTGLEIPTVFSSFDDYWQPFLSGVAPGPGYVVSLDPAARNRLRDHLERTLPTEPDGSIDLVARAWAVRGRT